MSNISAEIMKILSNLRPGPKIGVAYKKLCMIIFQIDIKVKNYTKHVLEANLFAD